MSDGVVTDGVTNQLTSRLSLMVLLVVSIILVILQLSGSLMVASLLEVVVGVGGFIRPLLRYIGPITVAPTISLIGLSLFKLPVIYGKINPPIALA